MMYQAHMGLGRGRYLGVVINQFNSERYILIQNEIYLIAKSDCFSYDCHNFIDRP